MWLPMLLLALMASSSAHLDNCQIRAPVIECYERGPWLTELDELPLNITELKLYNIKFASKPSVIGISNSTFIQRLQAFEIMNSSAKADFFLNWYRQELLSHGLESTLPSLRSLNISHNDFSVNLGYYFGSYNISVFNATFNQLRVLDMSYNSIDSITWSSFKEMRQLTWLSISSNKLNYIHPESFKYLESLEYLDLSNNELLQLDNIFDPLKSLQRLNLAGNKLMHIEARWFQNLSKLTDLDISRNKLSFIPADTLQPLASLSVFKFAENALIKWDLSLLLGTGRRLKTIDASRIGLVRIPALLTHSVMTLLLAGNRLSSIDSGDLDSYPLLRLLDLSENKLTIIEEDALGRLDGLEELILSNNCLPNVPKSLPSSLKKFDLSQNAISKLQSNDLQGLHDLKKLNLRGNVITAIEGGSFRQLTGLEALDISDNPIKALPSDTLSGPSNLVTLRMSGLLYLETEKNQNQDTAFPILTPESLVILDISRSPALATQLLADNAALSACKHLQELDLSYTNISTIRSDLAYVLPQLQKLKLMGNEWNCSADQCWLGNWIRQHETSMEYFTICAKPAGLEGKRLKEIQCPELKSSTNLKSNQMQINYQNIAKILDKERESTTVPTTTTSKSDDIKTSTMVASSVTTADTITNTYSTSGRLFTTINVQNVISTTPFATFIMKKKSVQLKEIPRKKSGVEQLKKQGTVSPPITRATEEPAITATNEEEWSSKLLKASDPEEYRTSTAVNYKSTKLSTPSADTAIDLATESNQDAKTILTTSATESTLSSTTTTTTTTTESEKDFTEDSLKRTSIMDVVTTILPPTTTTVNIPSVVTSKNADISTSTETIKESVLLKAAETIDKDKNEREKKKISVETKTPDRVVSELSRSKLLQANEGSQIIEEQQQQQQSELVEELSSQATELGARTSETISRGAHPGMLVLLGAAIGAAAALTVVLSRRATLKKRDRLYQRHENIEVHALTPTTTTELW